jgi:membrane associated rhomboid family serine protease
VEKLQWRRIFTAPLVHADEMHLVYNLSSFLIKGAQLGRGLAVHAGSS